MAFAQTGFDVRCEWGLQGVSQLAPISDVVVCVTLGLWLLLSLPMDAG